LPLLIEVLRQSFTFVKISNELIETIIAIILTPFITVQINAPLLSLLSSSIHTEIGIANATVTLTTRSGTEINTTQTDSTSHYAFANVSAGFYDITATKRSYWPYTNNVTVTAEASETADILLCQKGDLNTNSEPADAGDLAMMADATKAGTSDVTYDLDGDGNPADEADLTLLKDVSVSVDELE